MTSLTSSEINSKDFQKISLKDFQKIIKKYKIKSQEDIKPIHYKWIDLTKSEKTKLSKLCVNYWNDKNTKIINLEDLQILEYYVKNINNDKIKLKNIQITDDYKFNYIIYNDVNIRQENIFKLNLLNIINKLKTYFVNVDIDIFFEKYTWADKEIKITKAVYKHDVIINIKNIDEEDDDNINNTFEIVLEYFEKIHNRFSDGDKYISAKQTSDEYIVFNEKTDDINDYYTDTIYSLIKFICATSDDKYELSKILYYKNISKKKNISLMQYFNKIIDYKKNKTFNFENFLKELWIKNKDTNKYYTLDEFIYFLEEEYEIEIELDDLNNCDIKYFEKVIMGINENDIDSEIILEYRYVYINALNMLNDASDEIIKLMKTIRIKRFQLPTYVKNLIKYHKHNLKL
jgi:hypothetical protein